MNITKELLDIVEDRISRSDRRRAVIPVDTIAEQPGEARCPDHDRERLDRIDGQLQDLKRQIGGEV